MTNANLNIRTEKEIKEAAEDIFSELGLNMTTAVNMFLRQAIRINGIPFELRLSEPNEDTIKAIVEGRKLAEDPKTKKYSSIDDLRKALEV